MSLRRAHEAAEVARDDFAATSQRVLREVDRFKRETTEDMRLTVLEYIRMQVDYNKKMEEIWATLIPQLERVQLDSNANVIGDAASASVPGATNSNVMSPPIGGTGGNPQIMPPGPQIHSQPMVNPQQPYMQATSPAYPVPNQFLGQGQPQPHQGPGMIQYREDSGGF
jgi:hypothetical protein